MHIKRTLTFIEEIAEEAGQRVEPPLRKVAVAAIIDNPFAGRFERDLKPLTDASAGIGRTICALAISMLAPHKAQSYGKAAVIGVDGEQEHGVSMLTTVFGNVMREAASGGKAWISSFTKRARQVPPSTSRSRIRTRSTSARTTTASPSRCRTRRSQTKSRSSAHSPTAAAPTIVSAALRRARSKGSTG